MHGGQIAAEAFGGRGGGFGLGQPRQHQQTGAEREHGRDRRGDGFGQPAQAARFGRQGLVAVDGGFDEHVASIGQDRSVQAAPVGGAQIRDTAHGSVEQFAQPRRQPHDTSVARGSRDPATSGGSRGEPYRCRAYARAGGAVDLEVGDAVLRGGLSRWSWR